MGLLNNPVGGFLYWFLLGITSLLGSIFVMGPYLPLVVLHPPLFRKINDSLISLWLCLPVVLFEKFYGVNFSLTGEFIRPKDRCVIIMNHRTRLDWMYFWTYMIRSGGIRHEKIILKSQLKHVPGAGWAMQNASYIFLERSWDVDRQPLTNILDYMASLKYTPQILLFPEGTDFEPKTKERSDRYAVKNGLPTYDFLLHPRTTGFSYLVQYLREHDMLDAVYDVTVGYPDNIPNSETDVLKGHFARQVNFDVHRHSVSSLPLGESALKQWCTDLWGAKEKKLEQFYRDKKFVDTPPLPADFEPTTNAFLWLALLFWTLFLVGSIYFLWWSTVARWYLLVVVVFYVVQGSFLKGMTHLEISCYNRFWSSKKML